MHVRPIPRLGGIALLFGVFVPALAFMELTAPYGASCSAPRSRRCRGRRRLPRPVWWAKLGGQSVAAAIPIGFGVAIDRFTFPFLGSRTSPPGSASP